MLENRHTSTSPINTSRNISKLPILDSVRNSQASNDVSWNNYNAILNFSALKSEFRAIKTTVHEPELADYIKNIKMVAHMSNYRHAIRNMDK